jgi:hypothetical protein
MRPCSSFELKYAQQPVCAPRQYLHNEHDEQTNKGQKRLKNQGREQYVARKVAERNESVRNVLTSSLGKWISMASMCTGTYTERAGGKLLRKKAGRLCRHCEPGWRTQH